MSEGPISGDEMAARLGLSPEEFRRDIARSARKPRVLVVPRVGDARVWDAICDECGVVVELVDRDVAMTSAHKHNSEAHADAGRVEALGV
ncbi:MAG: hypothetical protein JWP11_51 [Frankiales bacterium]|nr:hypothetical protein [Frankiales bacterium]